jgi:hypothetical protein
MQNKTEPVAGQRAKERCDMPNNTSVATGMTRVPTGVLRDAIYKCLTCKVDDPYRGAVMFDVWNDNLVLATTDGVSLVIVKLAGPNKGKPDGYIRLTPYALRELWHAVRFPRSSDTVFNWERKQCQAGDRFVELETDEHTPPPWRAIVEMTQGYNAWFTASALCNAFAGLKAAHCEIAVCKYTREADQLQVESRSKRLRMYANCDVLVKGTDNFEFAVDVKRMYAMLQRVGCERVRIGKDWREPLALDFSGGVAFLMPMDLEEVRLLWKMRESQS